MIRIDPRKGSKELYPYFLQALRNPPIPFVMDDELPFGDISFIGRGPDDIPHLVGIERKTLTDLISCIHDGRYAGHQLPGLGRSFNSCWLLVEGIYRRGPGGELVVRHGRDWAEPFGRGILYSAFEHWLASVEVCTGVRVRRSAAPADTVDWIIELYTWWQKEFEDHRSHMAFDESNALREIIQTTHPTLIRCVAKELPGIGWHRSRVVEGAFPNVHTMVNSDVRSWMSIEGIGKVIANQVYRGLRTAGYRVGDKT